MDIVVRPPRVEASWWRRWRFEAQRECRELLFSRYVPLARTIAARHFRRRAAARADRHDFDHFAYEGLLEALERFDPLRGVPFDAYARPRIAGSIADGLASMSEVGTQLRHRRRIEQERLRSCMSGDQESDPLAALSELVGNLAAGLIIEAGSVFQQQDAADPQPSAYDSLAARQMTALIAGEIRRLPPRECEIIIHHYETGLSFAQIAVLLGLSRGRISQLHHQGLTRLRKRIGHWA